MIFIGLAIFAGLSLNLMLHFGFTVGQTGRSKEIPLFQISVLFVTVFVLWIIYVYVFKFLPWEFMGYFVLFPVAVLLCLGMEHLEARFYPKLNGAKLYSAMTAYEGLVPASLALCVNLAFTPLDALFLSFFFASGCLLAMYIIREINRRSTLEAVPKNFRGMPLTLISMGLLSMIFASIAWICYRILNLF